MHLNGINRIKVPVEANITLEEKVKELSNKESLADMLTGTELRREQLVYLYESIKIIWETPLKEYLIQNIEQTKVKKLSSLDQNCIIRHTIPCLLIYRQLKNRVKILKQMKIDGSELPEFADDLEYNSLNDKEDALSFKVECKYDGLYAPATKERLWL